MTEGIIIALVTGGLAVVSNLLVANASNSKTLYRLSELEKKVEKHNQVVERFLILERDEETQWKRIDELRGDMEDIKKEVWTHD